MLKKILRQLMLTESTRKENTGSAAMQRVSGGWDHRDIERLTNSVKHVEGDFAEIGVFRGSAFEKVSRMAAAQGKMAHAFDSFQGMDTPSEYDGTGYPKGKFNIGGPDAFVDIMKKKGVPENIYKIWAGFIPDCFSDVPESLKFSFILLDVDHYQPTVDGLVWAWPRLNQSGILALDDFIPSMTGLATKAIKEFLRDQNGFDIVDFFNNQLILRKIS